MVAACLPNEWVCIPPAYAASLQILKPLFVGNRIVPDSQLNRTGIRVTIQLPSDAAYGFGYSDNFTSYCSDTECVRFVADLSVPDTIRLDFSTRLVKKSELASRFLATYRVKVESRGRSDLEKAESSICVHVGEECVPLSNLINLEREG